MAERDQKKEASLDNDNSSVDESVHQNKPIEYVK